MNSNSRSPDTDSEEITGEIELLTAQLREACNGIFTANGEELNILRFSSCLYEILLHGLCPDRVREYYSILVESEAGLNFLLNLDCQTDGERVERLNRWILSKAKQQKLSDALSQLLTAKASNIDSFYTQQAFVRRTENRIVLQQCVAQIEAKCAHRKIVAESSSSAERAVEVSDESFHNMPNICDTSRRTAMSLADVIEANDVSVAYSYTSSSSSTSTMPRYPSSVPIQLINVDDIEIHTDCHHALSVQEKSKPLNISKSSKLSLDHLVSNQTTLASMSTSPTEILFNVAAVDGGKLKNHYSSPVIQTFSDEKLKKSRKSSRHNLAIFLESLNMSSRTKVDLDREARHFHLSEAIIATSQHMKMNRLLSEKYNMPESARKAREQPKLEKKRSTSSTPSKFVVENLKTKFIVGSTEDESSDSSENLSITQPPVDNSVPDTAPHLEWTGDPHSAESIALMLMTKFKSQPLPNPNELYWLVNESQAPQQILPFGDLSVPVNPDDDVPYHSMIRGNDTWAPPRNMLIFHVQPPPERRRLLMQQNHRCAGCGQKVAPTLVHTFRYCHYLGKYFCSACHKNQIALIPARVISNWDFTLYHVSNFSLKWLDEIWNLPLFHIGDLKPQLYERVKQLSKAKKARAKLQAIGEFIARCRFAQSEKSMMKTLPEHWLEDVDVWSMNDFVDIQNGTFIKKIQETMRTLEAHIVQASCELCKARGWICEGCPNKSSDVIFPWQEKVARCARCGSCYHEKCLKECSKCERLKRRSFNVVKKPPRS